MMPKISVIMPVYNCSAYIDHAIQSILNQTEPDFELLIIDDGSPEPVFDIIRNYRDSRIRAYREPENEGFVTTLNKLLNLTKGDFIARMDGDDISYPERFEKQLKRFDDNVGFVGCWAESIDKAGNKITHYVETNCRCTDADLINIYPQKLCMADPTMMYSRQAVDRVGIYDTGAIHGADYNYTRRIQRFYEGRVVPEILYVRRVGSGVLKYIKGVDYVALANIRAAEYPVIR